MTGFDAKDGIPLRDLRIGPRAGADQGDWGPFRLINTALNLVAGEELAWQDRKAESFTLTPLYCGSKSTGYRELTEAADEVMTLGRATAISGSRRRPQYGLSPVRPGDGPHDDVQYPARLVAPEPQARRTGRPGARPSAA